MKKLFYSLLIPSLILINSCGDVETPVKYMSINGTKAELESAYVYDLGTDVNISFRTYELEFNSSATYPSDYIDLEIYSTSTSRLQEGTYTYDYIGNEAGLLSYVEVGRNIQYDDRGVAISGTKLTETNSTFSGTVTVSRKNDNYDFIFNLTAEYNGETYTIQGEYNDVLTEY